MTISKRRSPSQQTRRRILCCWLPDWPLQQRLQRVPSEQRTKLQVIYSEERRQGRTVVLASKAARRRGVRAGMPLAEAEAMLPPTALFFRHDPQSDRESLQQLAIWGHKFSPHTALETPLPGKDPREFSPESFLSDVTLTRCYFGGEWKLLRKLASHLAERGLHARLAIAHSIGAAWALAHAAPANIVAAPDFSPGLPLPPLFANLPVTALRIPFPAIRTLHALGLETIGQLAAIPTEALCLRLDSLVVERLQQFLGNISEPLRIVHAAPRYRVTARLETPATDWRIVGHHWQALAEQLARQLAQDHRGALQLDIELLARGQTIGTSLHLASPHTHARQWFQLWELHRESLPQLRDIHTITITASVTARPTPPRAPLLPAILPSTDNNDLSKSVSIDEWTFMLDRLAARLDRRAVFRPRLLAEVLPERGWSAQPPTRRPPRLAPERWHHLFPAARPLSLVSPPAPLDTGASTTCPHRFRWAGRSHQIRRRWGPQRLEGGWWKGATIARDYYHVETTEARRYWIFYCENDRRWYLHGWDG